MDIMIIRASNHETAPVGHQPEFSKRVIVPGGILPGLLQFATADFQTDDVIAPHTHQTMAEVFYVLSGMLHLSGPSENHALSAGDCFVVFPGVEHGITFLGPSKLLYFNLEMADL